MADAAWSCTGSIIGPRSRKFIACKAMMLSMMVLRISLTLKYALSTPGMPPHNAPPRKPAISAAGTRTMAGASGKLRPSSVAGSAPTMNCPSPPMLITPARKAMQMPKPTSNKGVARTMVSASAFWLPNAPLIRAL